MSEFQTRFVRREAYAERQIDATSNQTIEEIYAYLTKM